LTAAFTGGGFVRNFCATRKSKFANKYLAQPLAKVFSFVYNEF
jgi:hypothetical protein